MDTPFLTPWTSCFFVCTSYQQKNIKLCMGPFNEHSYQVWLQLAEWFQRRRLKCKSIQMKPMMTDAFGSGELKLKI
jgi:hypothetical protein